MSHFICKGSCSANAEELTVCEADGCSSQWEMLEECSCEDNMHGQDNDDQIKIVDCDGEELKNGDSVIVTKDLKVKGAADLKRGTVFKNIKLTDDPTHIDCGKIMLKTIFAKKKK